MRREASAEARQGDSPLDQRATDLRTCRVCTRVVRLPLARQYPRYHLLSRLNLRRAAKAHACRAQTRAYKERELFERETVPLLVVASVALGLTTLASAVGVAVGRRLQSRLSEHERSQLYGIQASLLGLLALLLGFSFGLGQTRYDLRRQLVVDEANAIATSRLRAAAVPDEVGSEIQDLLKAYVDSRVAIARARTIAGIGANLAESERLQREVWSRAARLAKQEPRSIPAGLLLQSLNQMIDLDTERISAARNHIPTAVLGALLLVAIAAMGWVGAGFGSTGRRGMVTLVILSALIAFVIAVIVDLDQPRSGFIRVSQRPLFDLQRALQ
jgi:hypothetical protein